MRRVERLKSEARQAASQRGHVLKPFLRGEYNTEVFVSVCRHCEMGAVVDPDPAPNGIDISGRAVAMNCKRDASLLPTKCSVCGNEMEGKRTCPLCGQPEGIKG